VLGVLPADHNTLSEVGQGTSGGGSDGVGVQRAPLDLIREHLTDEECHQGWRRPVVGYETLAGWWVREDFVHPASALDGGRNCVLTVQEFAKGGYEATVRALDLTRLSQGRSFEYPIRARKEPAEWSLENQQKAAQRARRKMRHLVRNMMADHLVTFTKREAAGAKYWTPEEWAAAWDRFRRNLVRVTGDFPYVAILERHEKGNYHLHVAWQGRVAVRLVRAIWLGVIGGGRGCGNIDARLMRVHQAGGDRATRIARYISKYVGKGFDGLGRYNKKRYWSSKQDLAQARRYVLRALTIPEAICEAREMLGLDFRRFVSGGRSDNLFFFPDGSGVWISYIPELHGSDPPF